MFETDQLIGLWDGFPVSPGHALVVPRRHVATWFDASRDEQIALLEGIERARQEILKRYQPDGFNIGINVHAAAGQTVFHLHVHLIPRYSRDVSDPRGGVRNVIPLKGNYLKNADVVPHEKSAPHEGALIHGHSIDEDPLLPHLLAHLDRAVSVDFCVAFIQLSGLRLLEEHLRDLLSRGCRLRILTGDYMDVTDPQALQGLLDLDGNIDLRVFEARRVSFHPKSYIFHFRDGTATALVGSSNLSNAALRTGVEWNYRTVLSADSAKLAELQNAFDSLFHHPATQPVNDAWIKAYTQRRDITIPPTVDVAIESPEKSPEPHHIQREALAALQATRSQGNTAGLVVLATGLGKTWLSAFDSNLSGFERVLFVAHREEILGQAIKTFRRIRPNATLGRYTGTEKFPEADILFASIQTLGRQHHLRQFDRSRFDYIIVDEFHHAAASTYRNLIGHFTPKFLLGLTATPERTDGGDLLAYCGENLVYRCDVTRGIRDDLLVPFHYFGVPDEVDYRNIPWRNNRFDEVELTRAVATQKRAQNALDQYKLHRSKRTLAFCCSQRHCDFMAGYFSEQGLRTAAVHSGETSDPRAASLEGLEAGLLDIVFAVDMFNEGVDIPSIDTVMMLRPTESTILWMQQFGRGLRKAANKPFLTVIDYIGNHRIFLNKPRTLLGLNAGDRNIDRALNLLLAGEFSLPPGCEVTYELKAVEILRSLLRQATDNEALEVYYRDFRERYGKRPTATELYHEGYTPRSLRTSHGSWLLFVKSMGDLPQEQQSALDQTADFLVALEITPMTKSFKMLTLLAMLDEDALPGTIPIKSLADSFARLVERSAVLRQDIGPALMSRPDLIRLLETNPIDAWIGGRGMGKQSYFNYDGGTFSSRISIAPELRESFQELIREIVDWRMAEYLSRTEQNAPETAQIICKVSHSNGRPILFLPDRVKQPGIPSDWIPVEADGKKYEANFVKVAVNLLREPGTEANILPNILTQWFGPDAGRPGTNFQVVFEPSKDGYRLRPARTELPIVTGAELWRTYSREEIPPLFGLVFSPANWNAGFVSSDQHVFLLVTLEKGDLFDEHQYEDKFLSPSRFQWISQNRTTQASKHGQMIRYHEKKGISVHLFVRRTKKIQGRPAPFYYCGNVIYDKWERERPITIDWKLPIPVPERLQSYLLVPPA